MMHSENQPNNNAARYPHEDVKPPRGLIPPVPEGVTSHTASHGFFKVFLIVGEGEEMVPVKLEKPQPTLSIQHFVAIPGMNFSCKVVLARAPPQGIQYGCRLYIDQGGIKSSHENIHDVDQQREIRVLKPHTEQKHDPDSYNQFFWFGPGETEYTVHGFYCNAEEEYRFQFGELPRETKQRKKLDERDIVQRKDQLGVIRFQFAKVKRMVPNTEDRRREKKPLQAKDFASGDAYLKGTHLSARPGKRIKIGVRRDMVAELEDNICYESVIHYNDVFGYENSTLNIYGDPGGLRGIPLSQIGGSYEVRSFLIRRFLVWLQNQRFVAELGATNNADAASNKFAGTEDLVHFINSALSPAAAYILCTGRQGPNNFGEKLVQARIPAGEQLAKHFEEKEDGLIAFFSGNPTTFELENNGRDEAKRVLWSVRLALIVIDSDSESE